MVFEDNGEDTDPCDGTPLLLEGQDEFTIDYPGPGVEEYPNDAECIWQIVVNTILLCEFICPGF